MVFALPLAVLVVAAVMAVLAARQLPGQRTVWLVFALMSTLAAAASAAALVSSLTGTSISHAYYFGSSASVLMLGATAARARRSLAGARLDGVLEALIFVVLAGALSVYFVIVPGLEEGDPVLAAAFVVDFVALSLAALCAIAGARSELRVTWAILGGVAAATTGDGVLCAGAAGQVASLTVVTALTWGMAGVAFAWAAGAATRPAPVEGGQAERWISSRILVPFAAVVALPEIALVLWATRGLTMFSAAFFGSVFVLVLLLVFARQAYLLRDNRRAIMRERRLAEQMARRNHDLKALTEVATTITDSLDEATIVERGLHVLRFGARADSTALHVPEPEGARLVGADGDWDADREWASPAELPRGDSVVGAREGRLLLRLPLEAREQEIGAVTLVRSASDRLEDEELRLIEVLANQLAIAIQNARDYRDRVEQAMRDPLTGVYNRRFFYEALEKEVSRTERYGSPVSMVIFDIDDFKAINDSLGRAKGDEALCRVTEIAERQIRHVDSFARLGGEEFGLLLPETHRLDALLVADRVRAAVARQQVLEETRVTLSAGVASCPQDVGTSDQLEKRADAALYWAKRNGKNICAVANEVSAPVEGGEEEESMPAHLSALVSTIDAEPLHTRDHSENVSAYAVSLGQALGLTDERIVTLRRAAFLHDIGKIAVPRITLAKPGRLDKDQWAQIRIHPGVGSSMLVHAGFEQEAVWVGQHHEQLDVRGYPLGLRGEQIALEARIILVADAFEAMTSDRPYRDGMPVERALAELQSCAGTQFDPRVVAALAGLLERGELAVLALTADR